MASGSANAGPAATELEKGINKTVSEYFTGSACSESAGKAPTVRAKNAAFVVPNDIFANVGSLLIGEQRDRVFKLANRSHVTSLCCTQ